MKAVREEAPSGILAEADRRMLAFAVKLTLTPKQMSAEDLQILRETGFSDAAIHDIVQITGLFNYYNRLADGLGIELEPGMAKL